MEILNFSPIKVGQYKLWAASGRPSFRFARRSPGIKSLGERQWSYLMGALEHLFLICIKHQLLLKKMCSPEHPLGIEGPGWFLIGGGRCCGRGSRKGGGVKWQLQGGVQLELEIQAGWGQPLATVDFAIQLCKAMKGDQPNSQCGYFVSLQDEE